MGIQILPEAAMERGTFVITHAFQDADGVAVAPESAKWTLTKADGTVVNGRQDVVIAGPTSTQKVTLTGADLAILDGGTLEERVFTMEWTFDSGKPANDEGRFKVQALVAIP